MRWVWDTDVRKTFMVYDEDKPETAPVVCREIRKEADACLLSAAPLLLAEVKKYRRLLQNLQTNGREVFDAIEYAEEALRAAAWAEEG